MISERTGQLQELRRQLTQKEQDLCELRRDKETELGGEKQHLRSLLKEKEAFIKVFGHSPPFAFPLASSSARPVLRVHFLSGADSGTGRGCTAIFKGE